MKKINALIVLGGALVILVRLSFFSLPETLGDNWVFYEMLPFYVLHTVVILLFVNCLVRIKRDGENLKYTEYRKQSLSILSLVTMTGIVISIWSDNSISNIFLLETFNDTHLWTNIFLCFYFFFGLPKLKSHYEKLGDKKELNGIFNRIDNEESDLILLNLRD